MTFRGEGFRLKLGAQPDHCKASHLCILRHKSSRRHSADSLELDEFLACEELQKLLQEAGQHKSLKIWQDLEEGERQELLHLQ